MKLYDIAVVKPLRTGERSHSVVRYHVVAETEVQAGVKIREFLQDQCTRWEWIGKPEPVRDVQSHQFYCCTQQRLAELQGKSRPPKPTPREPKLSTRPIGETQIDVLKSMVRHGGYWHQSCGWYWDNHSGTARICETLYQRCLVHKTTEGRTPTYTINEHGRKAIVDFVPSQG